MRSVFCAIYNNDVILLFSVVASMPFLTEGNWSRAIFPQNVFKIEVLTVFQVSGRSQVNYLTMSAT